MVTAARSAPSRCSRSAVETSSRFRRSSRPSSAARLGVAGGVDGGPTRGTQVFVSAKNPDEREARVLIATDGSGFATDAARRAIGLLAPTSRYTVLMAVPLMPAV